MSTDDRRRSERRGRRAEIIVAWRYRFAGYRLIRHRYRCHEGEIDLIMRRGRHLVFIEVKYTSAGDADHLERVLPSPWQQNRIRAAAAQFLATSRIPHDTSRIDVVVLGTPFGYTCFRDAIR